MNKKHFLIFALAVSSFVVNSCSKSSGTENNCVANNTGVPTAAEVASLQSYITANSLPATQHPDGFFYRIVASGSGATPTLASTVTFKYTGRLMDGSIFDQSTTGITYPLNQLILGFRKGLPLIQKGGSIILYLPPSLGYGCQAVSGIPPGSNLIFTVDLTDVQ
jgi:FKBP-type peptidyl-prolyl cis-trans isomerase FkpA